MNMMIAPMLEPEVSQANTALTTEQATALSQAISMRRMVGLIAMLNENLLVFANVIENLDHAMRSR